MLKVNIPEGKSKEYVIQKFTISPKDAMFAFRQNLTPGEYTRLTQNGHIWMSDTPQEWRDHLGFIYKAKGDVLINGLGLGLVILAIQDSEQVNSVTVNELSEDVIRLVAPTYTSHPKITINQADAFTWKPQNGQRFDAVWHDIWGDVSVDDLKEMSILSRRYGHWLKPGGFQACWKKEYLQWIHKQKKTEWLRIIDDPKIESV